MRRILTALTAILLVAGCTSDDDDDATVESTTAPPTSAPATTTTSGPPSTQLAGVAVSLTEIASVDEPTAFAVRSGEEDLYVTERGGTVRRIGVTRSRPEAAPRYQLERSPVLDLSDDVQANGQEQGLLGIVFSSDGRRLYVAYTGLDDQQYVDGFTMAGDDVDERSRTNVLTVPDFAANHNGGQLALGPDGFLYYGMGDGGGGGDPEDTGQNPDDLLGSILRIDPDGGDPYVVPSSNPFANGGGAPEVWAYGLRNPWRFSFDRTTGDLWIADVGQVEIEEIDFLPRSAGGGRGANLGWSEMEGDQAYEGGSPPDSHVPPIFSYTHDEGGCSVTGGYVYRGSAIPALVGAYLYGDFCVGELRALVQIDGQVVEEQSLGMTVPNLSSFGEDADGELWALSLEGPIYRIDPA
ncbi:MAG: PQQ-dependent sugar dehydrogenase [Acidimicrobiales bacterium]